MPRKKAPAQNAVEEVERKNKIKNKNKKVRYAERRDQNCG